jgi:hypothetical protein
MRKSVKWFSARIPLERLESITFNDFGFFKSKIIVILARVQA